MRRTSGGERNIIIRDVILIRRTIRTTIERICRFLKEDALSCKWARKVFPVIHSVLYHFLNKNLCMHKARTKLAHHHYLLVFFIASSDLLRRLKSGGPEVWSVGANSICIKPLATEDNLV